MSKAKVFISYKTGNGNDDAAEALYNYLIQNGYDVFWDKEKIQGGHKWDDTIYEQISESNVLVLLLTSDAVSPWVQREVDFARGCRVQILPILINREDEKSADQILKALALNTLQYVNALSNTHPLSTRYANVMRSIDSLVDSTRAEQKRWVSEINKKWEALDRANPLLQAASNNPKVASYNFRRPTDNKWHDCEIHLAAGSITDMNNIHVLVNSENNYMQMGRIFDSATVSSTIRIAGAEIIGGRILTDTVQIELDKAVLEWCQENQVRGIPVEPTVVLVTNSGHPKSVLANQRRFRYIFHVASVVVNSNRLLEKLTDPMQIRTCIFNCLEQTKLHDKKMSTQDPSHRPIESIVFPLIGTGTGGAAIEDAVQSMGRGIKEWLDFNPSTDLKHIYISAFLRRDVELVKGLLDTIFTPNNSNSGN